MLAVALTASRVEGRVRLGARDTPLHAREMLSL